MAATMPFLEGQEYRLKGFPTDAPSEALLDPKKVVIVSNGRFASSCSSFSIAMQQAKDAKVVMEERRSTAVLRNRWKPIYRQSTPRLRLTNNTYALPDLLALGTGNPNEPSESQSYPADLNLPLTSHLANNPVAKWDEVAKRVLS